MADKSDEIVRNGAPVNEVGDAIDGNSAGTSGSAGGKKNKKGKNKNKAAAAADGEAGSVAGANLSADQQDKLRKAMEMLSMQTQGGGVTQLVVIFSPKAP